MYVKKIGKIILSLALPTVIGSAIVLAEPPTEDSEVLDKNSSPTESIAKENNDAIANLGNPDVGKTEELEETSENKAEVKDEADPKTETEEKSMDKAETKTEAETKKETEVKDTESVDEKELVGETSKETKVYVVSFDTNGGEGVFEDVSTEPIPVLNQFGSIVLPKDKPTREGYTFIGWCINKNGDGHKGQPGQKEMINSSLILYAIWGKNAVRTLNFDTDGGTNVGPINTAGDGTFFLPEAVESEGRTFAEWNTKSDGSGWSGKAGQKMYITQDSTIYAIFEDIKQEALAAVNTRNTVPPILLHTEEDGIASKSSRIVYWGNDVNAANKSYYYASKLQGLPSGGGTTPLIFLAQRSKGYVLDFQEIKLPTANSTFKFSIKNGYALPDIPSAFTKSPWDQNATKNANVSSVAPNLYIVMSWKAESGSLWWKSTKDYKAFIPVYAYKVDDTQYSNGYANRGTSVAFKKVNIDTTPMDEFAKYSLPSKHGWKKGTYEISISVKEGYTVEKAKLCSTSLMGNKGVRYTLADYKKRGYERVDVELTNLPNNKTNGICITSKNGANDALINLSSKDWGSVSSSKTIPPKATLVLVFKDEKGKKYCTKLSLQVKL